MNRTDRTVTFQIFLTIGVLVAIAIAIGWLASRYATNPPEQVVGTYSDSDFLLAESTQRILPVGHVITQAMADADPSLLLDAAQPETVAVVRTGGEVVEYLCASCHTAGVGGAPKLDDATDWGTRYANGMDALMEVGINGKAGTTMMPKGGDSSLSDDDIWNSIVAMLKQAGVPVTESERAPASEEPAAEESTEEAAATAAPTAAAAVAEVTEAATEVVQDVVEGAVDAVKSMTTTASDLIVDTATTAAEGVVEAAPQ